MEVKYKLNSSVSFLSSLAYHCSQSVTVAFHIFALELRHNWGEKDFTIVVQRDLVFFFNSYWRTR